MSDEFQRYEKLDDAPVGRGSFGEVWRVRTDKHQVLAAKYIDLSKVKEIEQQRINNEELILRQLNHRNVVRFFTAKQSDAHLIVFTEFIDGRDLSDYGRLDEPMAVSILKQICEGLHYLHTRNPPVLHRDLKGQNIMVTRDGTVKIIDFGLSIKLLMDSGMQATDILITCTRWCGTPPFIAPEVFKTPHRFSVKSDVWALGITLYQMLIGRAPDFGPNLRAVIENISRNGAPSLPGGFSKQLVDFYNCCTAYNPEDRPPVRSLMEHEVLKH